MKPSSKGNTSQTPNNLPPRPSPFVNREEEIRQAINILLDDKTSVVALVGMAGIGKTTLALEIAHRLLDTGEFTDGIVWLPARDLQSSDDLFSAVETELGISGTEAHTRLNSQRCLIILDGLDELAPQFGATVNRFLEELPAPSKALVTSRKSLEILPPAAVIQVDALDERAAIELFTLWGQQGRELSSIERQTATEVVRALGNHPLALTLAARLVRGDYAEARKLFDQTFDTLGELGDEQERAALLHTLASVAQAQGDYSQALQLYQQSLEIEEQLSDLQGKSATLNNLAQIYFARGDYDRALALYQESLSIKEALGDLQGKSATLNNISQIFHARGDYETALAYLERSLAIRQEIGDKAGQGATLGNIGNIHYARGDYETALAYLERSLQISQEIGDKSGEGTILNNISQIYDARGGYETALAYLERSLAIRQEIGDKAGEGAALGSIGNIYYAWGDYEKALAYLERSLAIRQEIGYRYGEAQVLHNLGLLYRDKGKLEKAVETLKQSQNGFAAIGLADHPIGKMVRNALADVVYELGIHYVEQDRWYEALRLFEESLAIYRQGDNLDARADTIYQIARTHHLIGNLDKARTHYRDALRLYEHTQNQLGIAACKTGLGRLMIQLGFLDDAIRELESAKQIYQQLGADQRMAEIEEVLQIANHVKERQRV